MMIVLLQQSYLQKVSLSISEKGVIIFVTIKNYSFYTCTQIMISLTNIV